MDIFRRDVDTDDIKNAFFELVSVVDRLRNTGGCPWDRKQTIDDTKEFFIEEVYELIEAISKKDFSAIEEELGDMLLLCVFLARICEEKGEFALKDSLANVVAKLIRRHPHVFGDESIDNADDVIKRWSQIKQKEKNRESVWDAVPKYAPAMFQYYIFLNEIKKYPDNQCALEGEKQIDKEAERKEIIRCANALSPGHMEENIRGIIISLIRIAKSSGIDPELLFTEYIMERRKEVDNNASE